MKYALLKCFLVLVLEQVCRQLCVQNGVQVLVSYGSATFIYVAIPVCCCCLGISRWILCGTCSKALHSNQYGIFCEVWYTTGTEFLWGGI